MEGDDTMSDVQDGETLPIGQLPDAVSALLASSRGIPSGKDFHFYNNFEEYKNPLSRVASKSTSLLESIGASSEAICKQDLRFPSSKGELDFEEAYDWLVNINDEIFERIDASLEEFKCIREEDGEVDVNMVEGGFQMVRGKKKKKKMTMKGEEKNVLCTPDTNNNLNESGSGVKVAAHKKDVGSATKAKVPYHIASIRRPQEEYNILVNNSSEPFPHVWLEKSDDGSRFVHPREKLSVPDFIDWSVRSDEPHLTLPLDDTPFKFVDDVKGLKLLALKLREINEFAIDLEHNQYRSFQGLTCLMQISTREEDYLIDTLKLKIHVGPHLRDIFKDPSKRKVMHGADRDIIWLQRDFGIYICNLFDTGQGSRKLKLERNSLEFLLQHFCGVTANKEYQTADWRLRPLPEEMIKYAREDTHYLLQIYDCMRQMLLTMPKENEIDDHPLLEVYKRSSDICMQLYEKDFLTDNSYLHVYGLQDAEFNAEQLSVASALFKWRDSVARAEDESTGYILPNKTLLEIAKQMPVSTNKLRRLLKSKHPYVERSLGSIITIIKQALQNSTAFEATAQSLKDTITEKANTVNEAENKLDEITKIDESIKADSFLNTSQSLREDGAIDSDTVAYVKTTEVSVQALKKPIGAFGSLLANSALNKKSLNSHKVEQANKLEKIRTSFPSIFGRTQVSKLFLNQAVSDEKVDIIFRNHSSEPQHQLPTAADNSDEDEPKSLAELSESFVKCLDSPVCNKPEAPPLPELNIQPFDYSAATKFWETPKEDPDCTKNVPFRKKKGKKDNDATPEFPAPRRRQAFPVTGNRSATFR